MYLQKRNNIYYVRYYEFGKDIKKSLYTSSRKIATMKVREFLLNQGSSLIKYKNLDIASFIREIQSILGEYQDKALSEYGEIETARFEAIGRFNEESISKKLEEYENLIFDIKNKNLIANEALKIIKRDKGLAEFLKQLSQKEEKELFYEMLLKIEAQVLKTDLHRVEQFRDLKSFEIKPNTAQNTQKNEEKPLNHTNPPAEQTRGKIITFNDFEELDRCYNRYFESEMEHFDKHTKYEHNASYRLLKRVLMEYQFSLPLSIKALTKLEDITRYYPRNFTKLDIGTQEKSLDDVVKLVRTNVVRR